MKLLTPKGQKKKKKKRAHKDSYNILLIYQQLMLLTIIYIYIVNALDYTNMSFFNYKTSAPNNGSRTHV